MMVSISGRMVETDWDWHTACLCVPTAQPHSTQKKNMIRLQKLKVDCAIEDPIAGMALCYGLERLIESTETAVYQIQQSISFLFLAH